MENEEIDTALEELESRLERLRALYEQYFLGIEKLEPQIPRKDVDRRIYVLRREKIRNTGKRFKLQTLISRYNTFTQYWQRICREIENGTYKRHLLRAERNIGPAQLLTTAAKRRFGRQNAVRDSQKPAAAEPAAAVAPAAEAAPTAAAASAEARPASEPAPALRPRSRTPTWPGLPTPPPPSGAPPPPPFNAQIIPQQVRVPAGVSPAQPTAELERRAASPLPAAAATKAPSSSPRRSAPFESLELDMDFMGDWDPGRVARGRAAPTVAKSAPEPPAARRGPTPRAPRETPPAASPPAASPRAQYEAPPAAPLMAASPRAQFDAPPAAPKAPAAPAPTAPSAPSRIATNGPSLPPPGEPRRLAPPPKPKRASALSAPPPAVPSAPPQPPPERRPPVQRPVTERPPAPRPASENPAAAAAARARAARPRTAAAEPANVSEGKLRELHQRLAEVSKGAGQPTVSFDGLTKSLRAAEAKLRAKHGNRRIDFEVVLKDGKAVVKPVVR